MTATTKAHWSNWAGNVHAAPRRLEKPRSEAELVDVVRRALEQRGLSREVVALRRQWAAEDRQRARPRPDARGRAAHPLRARSHPSRAGTGVLTPHIRRPRAPIRSGSVRITDAAARPPSASANSVSGSL